MKVINKENKTPIKINHPGRNVALQHFNKHCVAATPPSKGGETWTHLGLYNSMLKFIGDSAEGSYLERILCPFKA
jgi:hypothetical protein